MRLGWKVSIVFALLTLYSTARGQALTETTALLNDAAARANLSLSDPNAKKATAGVEVLGLSPASEEKVYALSARIFEKLANQAEGDSDKMGAKIQDLLRDPAALESKLSAGDKEQIHAISQQIK